MADKRVGHDFEGQRGERRVVGSAAQFHFFGIGVGAFQWRHVHRRRQKINDSIEQRLNALILERRAGQHRHNFQRQRGFANGLPHFLNTERAFVQILVDHFVVVFGDVLDDLVAMLFVECLINRGTF